LDVTGVLGGLGFPETSDDVVKLAWGFAVLAEVEDGIDEPLHPQDGYPIPKLHELQVLVFCDLINDDVRGKG
jgi:hypothetical protein